MGFARQAVLARLNYPLPPLRLTRDVGLGLAREDTARDSRVAGGELEWYFRLFADVL